MTVFQDNLCEKEDSRHNQTNHVVCTMQNTKVNEKSAQRDANTARALAIVRFGHRPHVANTQTHRQDQLQYTAPQLASAQCNKITMLMRVAIGMKGNNVAGSARTLLVGRQEGLPACKKLDVGQFVIM